jgi:hypothetical protein
MKNADLDVAVLTAVPTADDRAWTAWEDAYCRELEARA